MTKYHVGCGMAAIYAGRLNKNGDTWIHKTDVTDEAFKAVALYCLEHNESMCFNYEGINYRLVVVEDESN